MDVMWGLSNLLWGKVEISLMCGGLVPSSESKEGEIQQFSPT